VQALLLKGFRCFRDDVEIPIAKITLLVGENSTGKSSVLAAIGLVGEIADTVETPNFNQPPFELGSWDTIAHFHGGQGKRAREVELGCKLQLPGTDALDFRRPDQSGRWPRPKPIRLGPTMGELRATFAQDRAQPAMRSISMAADNVTVTFERGAPRDQMEAGPSFPGAFDVHHATVRVLADGGPEIALSGRPGAPYPDLPVAALIRGMPVPDLVEKLAGFSRVQRALALTMFRRVSRQASSVFANVFAGAPIRSAPQRTFDPVQEIASVEGDHIPSRLAMMHATDPVAWERLSRVLDDLGKETGLFDHLGIKRLGGKQLSRPFQLAISIAGQMGDRTLVDVGYGVSQALPVAVEALDRPQGATLLLQQPEVHLHPRAQAGLGAFFARVARDRGIRFVVETHSDYLVDRVRMAIRDGVLERRDVALLWFRSSQGVSRVDRIDLADDGSIREAPEGYREFFLREKLSILGGA
jgi:hypothetical protein